MSWETRLFCGISFNRKTYNNKYEVENDLEDLDKCINVCKQELRDIAVMTEFSKYYNADEYNSPYDFIHQTVENNLELLEEYLVERAELQLLLNEWDHCHDKNGLAIPPEESMWEVAYLDGDFVKTTKNPEANG